MTPEQARSEFPAALQGTYVNVSVNSLIPTRTKAAVERFIDARVAGTLSKEERLGTVERCRTRFAELIGAHPDEIAMIKNVSEGLNLVAGALKWAPGDNVIVCQDLEHPNNVFPWYNLARRAGIEVRAIPSEEGHVPVEAMCRAIDGRTRLLTAPTVGFSPGYRTRTEVLRDECRRTGVFFLLDAAQSVGVLDTDVDALGCDALAVATQKGLLSFYGAGFLYCRRTVAEAMVPPSLARFGVTFHGGAGETTLEGEDFEYAPGARRFDMGNFNYLGVTAAEASLSLIAEVGTATIEGHACGLASMLADGLLELGLPVCGGAPGPHLAHIVTVGRVGGGGHDTAEDPAINALYDHLTGNGVTLSIRRGVVRFSFHVYNAAEDVERILGLVRDWRRGAHGPALVAQ